MRASFGNRAPKYQWQSKCGFRLGIGASSGQTKTSSVAPSEGAAPVKSGETVRSDPNLQNEAIDNGQEAAYDGRASDGDSPIEQGVEPTAEPQQEAPTLRHSTRKRVATEKYLQYLEQRNPNL
jgi:hypothetical protein